MKGYLTTHKLRFLNLSKFTFIYSHIPMGCLWIMTFMYLSTSTLMNDYCIRWEMIALPWLYQALHKGAVATKYAMLKPSDYDEMFSDSTTLDDFQTFQNRLQVVSGWRVPDESILREQARAALKSASYRIQSKNLEDITVLLYTVHLQAADEMKEYSTLESLW